MKAEDFIGWKSDNGLLTVTGIHSYQGKYALYNVHCEICSKDTELFPNGFKCKKAHLVAGVKPCGCSNNYKWNIDQYVLLAQRASPEHIVVHGYVGEVKGCYTLIERECLIHNYKWTTAYTNLRKKHDCKKCALINKSINQESALKIVNDASVGSIYKPIGFLEGYHGVHSRLTYECEIHGIKESSYDNYVRGKRCKECGAERSGVYGFLKDRVQEVDTLYVLNFNDLFIKVGRSFNVDQRIKGLINVSGIKNVVEIFNVQGSHEHIYKLEQSLLSYLRSYCLEYKTDFTTESFSNESIDYINWFLLNES